MVEILQKFAAFSEYVNFTKKEILWLSQSIWTLNE